MKVSTSSLAGLLGACLVLPLTSSPAKAQPQPEKASAQMATPAVIAQGQAGPDKPLDKTETVSVYAHVGRGSGNETTGGAGFMVATPGLQRLTMELDFGIEGKHEDQTYGGNSIGSSYSLNGLVGVPISLNENSQVVPLALLGVRSYKTDCPTGDSYLGFRCYADYAPKRHWKFNYGDGATLTFKRVAVGVRATGQSVAGMAGFNFNF